MNRGLGTISCVLTQEKRLLSRRVAEPTPRGKQVFGKWRGLPPKIFSKNKKPNLKKFLKTKKRGVTPLYLYRDFRTLCQNERSDMNHTAIINEILELRGVSQKKVAKKIGIEASGLSRARHHKGIRLFTLWRVCEATDYEIIVRPKNYVKPLDLEMSLTWDD